MDKLQIEVSYSGGRKLLEFSLTRETTEFTIDLRIADEVAAALRHAADAIQGKLPEQREGAE